MFMWPLITFIFSLFVFCRGNSKFENISGKEYASLPLLFHLDNYDDCMLLEKEAFFCSVTYQLYPLQYNNNAIWTILEALKASPYNYRHDILRHGICVPKTCSDIQITTDDDPVLYEQLTNCYNENFNSLDLTGNVTKLNCDTVNPKYPADYLDKIFGFLFLTYLLFVLFATFYEKQINTKDVEKFTWKSILVVFSIRRNWIRLKSINPDADIQRLRCIQGMRFYNMVLVILVHTIMMLFVTLPVSNIRATETLTERLSTIFLASGPLCVSTFFMISSWLLIHGLLEKFKENEEISWKILVNIFINRYIRLTPSLAIIIAFQATWLRHLGTGPYWNHIVGGEYLRCRKNWWSNLLYINNYVDAQNMCMQTTWHLAHDTQYFALILLLIWITRKFHKCLWTILGSLLTLCICITFFENYVNDFPALMPPTAESLYDMNHTLKNKQWHIQYTGFFGNMAGPIIGLYFGYAYFRYKKQNIFTKNIHKWIWWSLFHACCYGTILVAGFLSLPENVSHDIFWASVHVAISRPIFAFGIGFCIFGITQGIEDSVKNILEWHPLYVLGRLTYSAYLVHIPLLLFRAGMIRSLVYINEYSVFLELMGNLAVTYLVATGFTLLFEMPVSALQKLVFEKPRKISVKKN